MRNLKTFLANLSHHPGVYQMLGEKGEILYVGKAKDLKKRISSYFSSRSKDLKTLSLIKHIKDIDFTVTHTENDVKNNSEEKNWMPAFAGMTIFFS